MGLRWTGQVNEYEYEANAFSFSASNTEREMEEVIVQVRAHHSGIGREENCRVASQMRMTLKNGRLSSSMSASQPTLPVNESSVHLGPMMYVCTKLLSEYHHALAALFNYHESPSHLRRIASNESGLRDPELLTFLLAVCASLRGQDQLSELLACHPSVIPIIRESITRDTPSKVRDAFLEAMKARGHEVDGLANDQLLALLDSYDVLEPASKLRAV